MQTEENLLSQLNDTQRQAVVYCDGPQLVIAGAGSGKTRVLTYKIAYLLTHYGVKPWCLLALTFTNKAANEMKSRIADLVDTENSRSLQMGTFHSIFSRILRTEATTLGFTHDFTIYDETDSRSLVKSICKQMGLDEKTYKPAAVHSAISKAKNRLQTPDAYADDREATDYNRRHNMSETPKIYMAYQQRLRTANAMDFDDLLVYTYELLNQHEDLRRKYAERYQYVLVDEYQDTNYVQQQILWLLTRDTQRVCVVGDDYQSIYAFRGAKIDNILNFQKVYTNVRLSKLERNYRSTQRIVAAANSLMKHNTRQIPKEVYSENDEGEKVHVLETISDKREAALVCHEIKRIRREENANWSDFAILYRTNAQSRLFEEEMRKPEVGMGDKYRIFGGVSFYQRKEIKDIIAYFRLIINHDDEEAFRRIVNYPARGIGDTTLGRIVACAQQHGTSLWQVISAPAAYQLAINRGTAGKLMQFRALIDAFTEDCASTDALTLAQRIFEQGGIKADLSSDHSAEGMGRRENVDSLISGIADFVQGQREDGLEDHVLLADYLASVSLMTDQDNDDPNADKVTLMTIHSAKGLEFPTVFVVGLEENIFPSQLAADSPREIEEERRLLYVAVTRAERHCFLTWAHTRWRYGKMDGFVNQSRFLSDFDSSLLDIQTEGGRSGGPFSHYGNSRNTGYGSADNGSTRNSRRLWDDDYEINRPYTGSHPWGNEYPQRSSRMQNSRPVAGQFMADPQPKQTAPRQAEEAVNPFSPEFEQLLRNKGRWSNVERAVTNGGRGMSTERPRYGGANGTCQGTSNTHTTTQNTNDRGVTTQADASVTAQTGASRLQPGAVVEHNRFGRGVIAQVSGTGENAKAVVDFDAVGRKVLLLKFARLRIAE